MTKVTRVVDLLGFFKERKKERKKEIERESARTASK